MIEVKNLTKTYTNTEILKNINLTIEKGSIFGIAGRSGTGKSTLLRCINGIENFDSGTIKVKNLEVNSLNKSEMRNFRKNVGMIFQNFALLNRSTVYDNIALPMKFWNYDKNTINKRVKDLLNLVDMSEKIYSRIEDLSGGQKQRVAIARALSMNPEVLLCDEATSALDPKSTRAILELLKEINKKLGITIVVVTHEMPVLKSICEKIAILENGSIKALGTTDEIFTTRPEALINLLGDREIALYENEKAIEFFYSKESKNEYIVSELARDLDINFSIIGGELDSVNENSISSMVIKFKSKYFESIEEYFIFNNILWREILPEKLKEDNIL